MRLCLCLSHCLLKDYEKKLVAVFKEATCVLLQKIPPILLHLCNDNRFAREGRVLPFSPPSYNKPTYSMRALNIAAVWNIRLDMDNPKYYFTCISDLTAIWSTCFPNKRPNPVLSSINSIGLAPVSWQAEPTSQCYIRGYCSCLIL